MSSHHVYPRTVSRTCPGVLLCSLVTTDLCFFWVRLGRHHRRDADGRPGKYGAAFASQNPAPRPDASTYSAGPRLLRTSPQPTLWSRHGKSRRRRRAATARGAGVPTPSCVEYVVLVSAAARRRWSSPARAPVCLPSQPGALALPWRAFVPVTWSRCQSRPYEREEQRTPLTTASTFWPCSQPL